MEIFRCMYILHCLPKNRLYIYVVPSRLKRPKGVSYYIKRQSTLAEDDFTENVFCEQLFELIWTIKLQNDDFTEIVLFPTLVNSVFCKGL